MSSPQPISYFESSLDGSGSNKKLRATGPWMLVYGGTAIQVAVELRAVVTGYGCEVRCRFAETDPNEPDAWEDTEVAGPFSTNGAHEDTITLSAITDSDKKMWVQLGLFCGGNLSTAFARVWASIPGAGWIVARQRVLMEQDLTDMIVPIGKPFAVADVGGLMFAITYTGVVTGINNPNIAWREFKLGNPDYPDTWDSGGLTADVDPGNTKETIQTTDTEFVPAGSMLVQAGFKYTTDIGGTAGYGIADIIVAAKK